MGTTAPTTRQLTLQCQFCFTWNRVDAARAADGPKCGKCARPMLLDRPWKLTDETFERTIAGSELPVLVDFWADWCGPCKMMAPAIDQLAQARAGRLLVAKLDTEANRTMAGRFQIRGIPTLILFRGGKPVATQSGAMPLASIERFVDSAPGA